jgi:hypothetical protein
MVTAEYAIPFVLLAQAALGSLDTLVNHELVERLRRRREARRELGLHAIREAIYAALFAGLAWFEWHGAAAALIAALLAAEVLVTAVDEWVENRSRVLPQNERVLHVFLTLNFGILLALLVPILAQWGSNASALVPVQRDSFAWLLSAFALASAVWSGLDLLAWIRLGRRQ